MSLCVQRASHTTSSARDPTDHRPTIQTSPFSGPPIMASNGVPEDFSVPNVLAAMLTMRSGDNDKKKIAVDYLGRFQKSVRISLASPAAINVRS